MQIKCELRKLLRLKRKAIEEKEAKDKKIGAFLQCNDHYIKSDLVLFYACLSDEINIDSCIVDALSYGKKVALPSCINECGDMNFYYIKSLDDLNNGYFGIREPNIDKCELVTDFDNCVCIVPALSYDARGYRLGYGKGYYDRFLQKNNCITIGLCYSELIVDELPTDEYDIPVDYIITQNGCIAVA